MCIDEINEILTVVSEDLDFLYEQRDEINKLITDAESYQDKLLIKRGKIAKKMLLPPDTAVAYSKNGKNKVTLTYRR